MSNEHEALKLARAIVKRHYPEMPADYSGRRVKIALDSFAATPSPSTDTLAHAVAVIIARCEAIEDAASNELAKGLEPHAAGYFRGEKALAKSIRRHLSDLTRTGGSHD